MGRGLKRVRGVHSIPQEEHVDVSQAKRVIQGGFVAESHENDITTATFVSDKKHVLIYNISTTTVRYVNVGSISMGVPAAGAAFPVLPQNQIVIGTDVDEYVRGDHLDLKMVVLAE